MAKQSSSITRSHLAKPKKKRAGRHSKKRSRNKNSKNYKKLYRGQGK